MKQHITNDQIKELNSKGKKEYVLLKEKYKWFDYQMKWLNDNVYFLDIGQMVEILGDDWLHAIYDKGWKEDKSNQDRLCDTLWEAVREELNK